MDNTCPLCMESAAASVTTVCGHTFCTHCLGRWTATNKTCPLCRESLPVAGVVRPPSTLRQDAAGAGAHQDAATTPPVTATPPATSTPSATTTLRERIEREHAERVERHHRLLQTEDRFDRYRSSVWTAS